MPTQTICIHCWLDAILWELKVDWNYSSWPCPLTKQSTSHDQHIKPLQEELSWTQTGIQWGMILPEPVLLSIIHFHLTQLCNFVWRESVVSFIIIIMCLFSAFHMSQCSLHYFPWSLGQYHSYNLSQLPGEYTAHYVQPFGTRGLIKHNNHLYPHRYPFILLGEEKCSITVKCLAQGHKYHRLQPGFESTLRLAIMLTREFEFWKKEKKLNYSDFCRRLCTSVQ